MHKVIFFHYRTKTGIVIPVYVAAPSLPVGDLSMLFSLKQKFKVVYARLYCILTNKTNSCLANKDTNMKSIKNN